MERPIWYKPSPITTMDAQQRSAILSDEKRTDHKFVIVDDQHGFVEVHGDGSVNWQKTDPNSAMAGATFAGLNFLEYPGYSDRPGPARPTFLVPFYDRD